MTCYIELFILLSGVIQTLRDTKDKLYYGEELHQWMYNLKDKILLS